MNISKTLKTGALAIALVVATAGASFAATYAWVDQDSKVKYKHNGGAATVNYVYEGQKVKIVDSWNNWYKIKIPGKDGWVKKHVLSFGYDWEDDYGGSFCINGDHASFCISGGY